MGGEVFSLFVFLPSNLSYKTSTSLKIDLLRACLVEWKVGGEIGVKGLAERFTTNGCLVGERRMDSTRVHLLLSHSYPFNNIMTSQLKIYI